VPEQALDPRVRRSRAALEGRFDELVAATPMFDLRLAGHELPRNPLAGLVDHVAENAALYRTLLVADVTAPGRRRNWRTPSGPARRQPG
jgi:hypothetical protein